MVCEFCHGSVDVLGLLGVAWSYFVVVCCVVLLCTSVSFRLCLEYERNGWRGKTVVTEWGRFLL